MQLRGTVIDVKAVSHAFAVYAARLIVTAADEHWLNAAVGETTGYGTSIIGCDAEVACERRLAPTHTPDGRFGAALLFIARKPAALLDAVRRRAGQCVMTCPTTSIFDGLPEAARHEPLGTWLGYFGDGHQVETARFERPGVVIPVMEGEFFCEAAVGIAPAVAGGTLLIGGAEAGAALVAARRAVAAMARVKNVITPFPGGVCRCGSKVGSRYRNLIASTHERYCPTLRDRTQSLLPGDVNCVYEIVVDGLSESDVRTALRVGVDAAAGPGATWLSSSDLGGQLGDVRIAMADVVADLPGD